MFLCVCLCYLRIIFASSQSPNDINQHEMDLLLEGNNITQDEERAKHAEIMERINRRRKQDSQKLCHRLIKRLIIKVSIIILAVLFYALANK